MRLLFATMAAEGHFGPLVPFARAAAAAGHEVAVAAPESFAASVERAGFPHLAFGDVPPEIQGPAMAAVPGMSHQDANRHVIRNIFAGNNIQWGLPGMRSLVADFRPDVILREPLEFTSAIVGLEANIRMVDVAIGIGASEHIIWDALGDKLSEFGVDDPAGLRELPELSMLPESFDPARPLTYRFRDHRPTPAALPDWWEGSGAPLVYMTFGSVAASLPFWPGVYRAAIDELADLDARVLLTVGNQADPEVLGPLPANTRVRKWVPQADALARAVTMVGHGGYGTMLGALSAGLPQVVVPLFAADQFVNAQRCDELGCGIGFSGPDVTGLADAVTRTLTDPSIRSKAEGFANDIAALPLVDEYLSALNFA